MVDEHLSYSRAREHLKIKLGELNYDASKISWHSWRACGATVTKNAGVNIRWIMIQGRWRCISSMQGYMEDSLENRLIVSETIGNM